MFEQQKKEVSRGGMWLVRGRVERRGEERRGRQGPDDAGLGGLGKE